jgi:undecaprenyl-diphosphatase
MIEILKELDRELFLFLNGLGHPYLDQFMIWMSAKLVWIPLYLLIIFFLIKKFKRQAWIPILLIIAAVGLSDFITSGIMKPFFERLRPCKDPDLTGLVVNIGGCGRYGFASSHAANTMALAVFLHLIYRNSYTVLLILWALVVSYSRVYLGVHYPGDILVGMIIGALLSAGLYFSISRKVVY